jgi:peptidoglycan hydrolase-like protein with peptidoglycan-binding domain
MATITASFALPAAAEAHFGDRTLRSGSSGHDVKVLQSWLTHLGFATSIDGAFGRGTTRSVRGYERKHRLRVNGQVEPGQARHMRTQLQSKLGTQAPATEPAPTGRARISSDGRTAVAPADAPEAVKRAIAAANSITDKPYKYAGGHGDFEDSGYDCSGAVSYALHGAGLVRRPLDSSEYMSWGSSGRGRWITVYAHGGHAYVVIAGLRFDTSGEGEKGPRWRREPGSTSGYRVRHRAGL